MILRETYTDSKLSERVTVDLAARTLTVTGSNGTSVRPLTDPEFAEYTTVAQSRAAEANRDTIETQAAAALAANAAFIALASPSAAQNAAQIKALTRQVNKLIRLVLGRLDGTD